MKNSLKEKRFFLRRSGKKESLTYRIRSMRAIFPTCSRAPDHDVGLSFRDCGCEIGDCGVLDGLHDWRSTEVLKGGNLGLASNDGMDDPWWILRSQELGEAAGDLSGAAEDEGCWHGGYWGLGLDGEMELGMSGIKYSKTVSDIGTVSRWPWN